MAKTRTTGTESGQGRAPSQTYPVAPVCAGAKRAAANGGPHAAAGRQPARADLEGSGECGARPGGGTGATPPAASALPTVYTLLPYQKRFIADPARFRLGLWARQTGKSFTSALDAVVGAIERGESWLVLSAGERQSLEWMEKAKQHARAWGYAAELEGDTFNADIQRLTIRFPAGNRIIGLPANPDTARGYSMNVILDEFAFHENSRDIWRALVPTITRGYRLVVLSTPNGLGNQFAELWQAADSPFSKHKVTIEDAAADGLAVNLAELRAAIDPDGWRQEFMCEFIDEASALLTYDLITACEDPAALWPVDPSDPSDPSNPSAAFYLGGDIGRKHDLTVFALLQLLGDVFWLRALDELSRTPFRDQLDVLNQRLADPRLRRACLDSTGLGAGLVEEAQRLHGESRVEAVQFTASVKEELAMGMLRTFQDRTVRIPPRRELRDDLHKIRKVTTAAGNVRYLADRDDAGHADRFWALALALHAGATAAGPTAWQTLAQAAAAHPGAIIGPLTLNARHPLRAMSERLNSPRHAAPRRGVLL